MQASNNILFGKRVSEKQISELLLQLGLSCNNKGYFYIKEALMLTITESDDYLFHMYNMLYPRIAKIFGTTPGGVERCIRIAIANAFTVYAPLSELEKVFKNSYSPSKGIPTNTQFIRIVAEYIKYNY